MVTADVVVRNRAGLHTRPAANIVKLAAKFKSDIYLARDGFSINAKSIIGVMTLAAEQGCTLQLQVDGPDADDAVAQMQALFEDGFGEL